MTALNKHHGSIKLMNALDMERFRKVPQYARGHAGRLLVVLAAIDALDRPTAVSIAALTGMNKGNVDRMALIELRSQFNVIVSKQGPVYKIEDWGDLLQPVGVKRCLTSPISEVNNGECVG